MQQIQAGLIGVRGFGRTHAEAIKTLPWVRLAAACDTHAEGLAEFAEAYEVTHTFADYREMLKLDELDCVCVATPHHLHHRITMDALAAGKHVLCEKPFATSSSKAQEMVAAARQRGLTLGCDYIFRRSPEAVALRHAVETGLLGDVYYVRMRWLTRRTGFWFSKDTEWRITKDKSGGGILVGRGCHLVDLIWHVLGKPTPESVYANCFNQLLGHDVEDFASLVLAFEGGCRVDVECSYAAHMPEDVGGVWEYDLFGTKGAAKFVQGQGVRVGRAEFPGEDWTDLTGELADAKAEDGWPQATIQDFFEAVRDKRRPLVSGEDAAWITRIIEAAYESSETKTLIHL